MKIFVFCFPLILTSWLSFSQFNVKQFGASGDGKTLDTKAIQAAIDEAHKNHGGIVEVPAGIYKMGTLILKDHVEVHLHPGAVLLGSPDYRDYEAVEQKLESRTKDLYAKYFMIFAEDAENISITGSGTVDGNGLHHFQNLRPQNLRPFMIRLVNCRDVVIREVHMVESANWTLHLLGCTDVNIDGVTIENHGEGNRDGLDIDACQRVTVSNSRFSTTDDAIVLKTSNDLPCQDIAITNCLLHTQASALKTGTESNGSFINIAVSNCVIRDIPVHAGIELMTVDGGDLRHVLLENIVMENVATPIFIKQGNRARPYKEGQYVSRIGDVADIFLNNIAVTNAKLPSSIMGLHSKKIRNVNISNYTVRYSETQESIAYNEVPLEEFSYPMALMYEKLPAYALYGRNVDGLHLENVLAYSVAAEKRPAMTFDRVSNLELRSVKADVRNPSSPMIHLRNVRDVSTAGCRSLQANAALFEMEEGTVEESNFSGNFLHANQREVRTIEALSDAPLFEDFPTETKYSAEKGTPVKALTAFDLGAKSLNVKLEILKNGAPQLCLLMLNAAPYPEKVLVTYKGITQEFVVSWNEWGWAPISLLHQFANGERVDFEVRAAKGDADLRIAKIYLRYQDTGKTD